MSGLLSSPAFVSSAALSACDRSGPCSCVHKERCGAGSTSLGHDEELVDRGLPFLVLLSSGFGSKVVAAGASSRGSRDLNTPCSH